MNALKISNFAVVYLPMWPGYTITSCLEKDFVSIARTQLQGLQAYAKWAWENAFAHVYGFIHCSTSQN